MKQKCYETKLPDFYPSSYAPFEQIMSCKLKQAGWTYVKMIESQINNFGQEKNVNKKQEISQNKLVNLLLGQKKLIYPNLMSIFLDLELSVSEKPFNKYIGPLQLKDTFSVYQQLISTSFFKNLPISFFNKWKDRRNQQIFKIRNFNALFQIPLDKSDGKFKTYKWNVMNSLNNFHFFNTREVEQLLDKSKNDEQKKAKLLDFDFSNISNIQSQTLIQIDNCNHQKSYNQQNKLISVKKQIKNKTKYFFQIKLVCKDYKNRTKIIGCTSKCYFYCQDQLIIKMSNLDNSFSKSEKIKRIFKCIQRSTIKDDCLKQGDIVIGFENKSQQNMDSTEEYSSKYLQQDSIKDKRTANFSKKNQTFRQILWIVQSIQRKYVKKAPQQYRYYQPLLQNSQAINFKQSDKRKSSFSQKQLNMRNGEFFFNGFLLRVDYPLKIKIDKLFPQKIAKNYIKKQGDKIFEIKFNIFLNLGDLLKQLKYKYLFQEIDLNKKYKFNIDKQKIEKSDSRENASDKFQATQLKKKDNLFQEYRKINMEQGQNAIVQIQLIQQDQNQKFKNSQYFKVILQENNLISVISKQKGVPVKDLKQSDKCLIYDQKLDDTDQNTVLKIQKLTSKKQNKIVQYHLTEPKKPYKKSFKGSQNITFSVGNDDYSNVIQQALVCDLYPRLSYSQNRFKAIRQEAKIRYQQNFYKIYFQKSDIVLFKFPVRITQQKVENTKVTSLKVQILQNIEENKIQFQIFMYNKDRMTQSFKHLIQPEFYRYKTIKNLDYQLSRQFSLIINKKIYSMYNNLADVLNQDISLQQQNQIQVYLTEVPKAYFHRLLFQWKQKQLKFKNAQFQSQYSEEKENGIVANKELQLPKIITIMDVIKKFNDPQDINTINNEYLMDTLCKMNKQNKEIKGNSTGSQVKDKQYFKYEKTYYNISPQLIKKQWFKEGTVFFFRQIIQVKKQCKQKDAFVLQFLTQKLLVLNKKNCIMDQHQEQKYYLPPYTYFFIQNVHKQQNKIYLKEIPCNVSFKKKVIIWVDYNFGKQKTQNNPLIKMIKQNPLVELVLMIDYSQAVRWVKVFEPILNQLNIKILLITNNYKKMDNQRDKFDQKQSQQTNSNEQKDNEKGGLILIKQIKQIIKTQNYINFEKPIIYCGDLQKAKILREKLELTDKDCLIINDQTTMKGQLSINALVVCDKFRGSLQSQQVNLEIVSVLNKFQQKMNIQSVQVADGGQGSLRVIKNQIKNGTEIQVEVTGPILKTKVKAKFYLQTTPKKTVAYIQMAQSSGLKLLNEQQRNPYLTTTRGVGQLITCAIQKKATVIYIFVGGSATNQGGIGMAYALGYKFLDINNKPLTPIGNSLQSIHSIIPPPEKIRQILKKIQFVVFTDVNNQFYGPNGATRVYGPQKGANTQDMLQNLDKGLKNLNNKLIQCGINKVDLQLVKGSGAAGGLAGGCMAFLGASIQKGTDYIMQLINLNEKVQKSDILITGEGRLDNKTLSGKIVSGIIQKAEKFNKQCVIICGVCEFNKEQRINFEKMHPKTKIIQLADNEEDVKNSIKQAKKRIQQKVTKHFKQFFKNSP